MSPETDANGLKRDIGLASALVLVIANMVGTGVFTTTGFIMAELDSGPALLACWLVGGGFALAGALCYGELGSRFPKAGGEYAYLYQIFGPLPAFLSGWISLIVGFSAPIAAAAIAFSAYIAGQESTPWFTLKILDAQILSISPASLLACAIVAVLSLVHCHSLDFGKKVQNFLTLFKIVLIIGFIIAGFLMRTRGIGEVMEIPKASSFSSSGFAVALIFVSFAYSGWNAAAYIGGEIKNPGKNLPLALILGTIIVTGLYLLLNLVYLFALPPDRITGVLEIGKVAAVALFGQNIGAVFGIAVAFGLLSVISAMIMAGPRVYFAMARDGQFFSSLSKVHETRRTPRRAILFQGGVAIGMILLAAFDQLLIYIGFTLSLCATLTVAGLFRLPRPSVKNPDIYRCPGYPFIPLFFIAGNIWIICYSIVSRPTAVVFGVLTILAGVAIYALFWQRAGIVKSDSGIIHRLENIKQPMAVTRKYQEPV
ncbi:amino acid permease [Desulfobacter hydrogenophilus]|uniref:Amino acid permease n=1 Tax=Desulfobacter hydrogenophilus TaxID=2291 RepID=A0A328FE66_9BACT|nr:amino acid permease [Desulfobacter hydrogenophilus]NDY71102.1 amino acid permease [Desulfobacter hydrogenophilus]QBH11739.1 amino acid permease [Desulfobacter hydrogenophilus]RAM02951.1 amino acid permease [Desulfobacter hydrogenophilus]